MNLSHLHNLELHREDARHHLQWLCIIHKLTQHHRHHSLPALILPVLTLHSLSALTETTERLSGKMLHKQHLSYEAANGNYLWRVTQDS